MNIFNHIINDQEIIGIGPLQWNTKTSNLAVTYAHYSFQLILRSQAIVISGEVAECYGTIEAEDRAKLEQFRTEYWIQRGRICKMLGIEDDQAATATEKLRNSCEQLNEDYLHLLSDLQPMIKTEKSKKLIHVRMKSIQDKIDHLKSLATA